MEDDGWRIEVDETTGLVMLKPEDFEQLVEYTKGALLVSNLLVMTLDALGLLDRANIAGALGAFVDEDIPDLTTGQRSAIEYFLANASVNGGDAGDGPAWLRGVIDGGGKKDDPA